MVCVGNHELFLSGSVIHKSETISATVQFLSAHTPPSKMPSLELATNVKVTIDCCAPRYWLIMLITDRGCQSIRAWIFEGWSHRPRLDYIITRTTFCSSARIPWANLSSTSRSTSHIMKLSPSKAPSILHLRWLWLVSCYHLPSAYAEVKYRRDVVL